MNGIPPSAGSTGAGLSGRCTAQRGGTHLELPLKIKPPLRIDTTAADFFADVFGLALTRLGNPR